jgi:hypothetical protein
MENLNVQPEFKAVVTLFKSEAEFKAAQQEEDNNTDG